MADLKARAYAVAALAEPQDGNRTRLQHMAAALAALEKGSGDEAVAREVWDLLAQAIRSPETLFSPGVILRARDEPSG